MVGKGQGQVHFYVTTYGCQGFLQLTVQQTKKGLEVRQVSHYNKLSTMGDTNKTYVYK